MKNVLSHIIMWAAWAIIAVLAVPVGVFGAAIVGIYNFADKAATMLEKRNKAE